MITEMTSAEIDAVGGGALEGAAASAGLLAAGFGALAAVPTPASPALATAAVITTVIGIGIGYFGTVYGAGGTNPSKPDNGYVKLK